MSHLTPSPGSDAPTTSSGRATKRTLFRLLGVVCMGAAFVLIGLAVADLVSSTSDIGAPDINDPAFEAWVSQEDAGPTKFWMFFLALPFFAAGGFLLNLGFSGATASYMAGEYSPAIQSVARDMGLRDDAAGIPGTGPYCRSCGTQNDAHARFCDNCGSSMSA